MKKSTEKSIGTFGLVIFIIMFGLFCGGFASIIWQHRNDPPRKSLREMITEIHQEIVTEKTIT